MITPPAAVAPPSRMAWVILGLILLSFLLSGLAGVNRQTDIDKLDTGRYLNAALDIRDHGGALTFPRQCLRFEYREDVQQPLFHLLLAPLSGRDLAFFVRAKLLTLLTGLAALVALFLAARRAALNDGASPGDAERADAVALLACLLLSLSPDFLDHATFPACEPLFILWLVLAWSFGLRWLRDEDSGWAAGVAVGLAYLTKGSGLLLLPLFILGALWKRFRLKTPMRPWGFVAAFVLVTSPLLLRNVIGYGNPFHDPNSSWMWVDRWEDSYAVASGVLPTPTPWNYVQSHSIADMAGRAFNGCCGVIGTLIGKTLALGTVSVMGAVLGGLVLALAAVGLISDRDRLRRGWTAAALALFLIPTLWYFPVVPGSRFVLAFAPLLMICAALGAVQLLDAIPLRAKGAPAKRLAGLTAAVCLVVIVVRLAGPDLWRNPAESTRLDPGFVELRTWLESHIPEGGAYAHGPSHGYTFTWSSSHRIRALTLPLVADAAGLDRWMREQKLMYLVLDGETLKRRGYLFGVPDFKPGATFQLRIPPGWKVAWRVDQPGGAIVLKTPD